VLCGRTNFQSQSPTLNSGTFGQITQFYDPRIMQFGMKCVF
jgi:hypothetical protein